MVLVGGALSATLRLLVGLCLLLPAEKPEEHLPTASRKGQSPRTKECDMSELCLAKGMNCLWRPAHSASSPFLVAQMETQLSLALQVS